MNLGYLRINNYTLKAHGITISLVALLFGVIVATIILGSVPPIDRDALTHHLFVPKLWLQHGGIYEIPEIPFSYYPMNLDLLYTIPLYFGNDIIPKYIHYLFALLTAVLLYRHLKRRLGVDYGLFGSIFFLSIPIIVKLSITVYVDLGVVFFTTASLLLLLYWTEQNFHWRWLTLAGLCCGLAAGTKYNGLISIVVLTLLVPLIYQQNTAKENQSNSKAFYYAAIFTITAIIALSPWLIRNYLWTKNPIYPLHNSLFQKLHTLSDKTQPISQDIIKIPPQQFTQQENNAFVSRKILYNESLLQTILLPIRYFYEGKDDDPRFFDGKLNPFLLLYPAAALLLIPMNIRQKKESKIFMSFVIIYFFFTFFQGAMRIRYITPIIPPLVILSAHGLHKLYNTNFSYNKNANITKHITTATISIVLFISLLYNAIYISNLFSTVKPLLYILNKINRDDYISLYRPEYREIEYANSILPRNTKVLCIFLGNRGYYMNFNPIFEQPNSTGIISDFLSLKNDNINIIDFLINKKISHVLMRNDLTKSWINQLNSTNKSKIIPLFENAPMHKLRNNEYTFYQL